MKVNKTDLRCTKFTQLTGANLCFWPSTSTCFFSSNVVYAAMSSRKLVGVT